MFATRLLMKAVTLLTVTILVLSSVQPAYAAAPPNDNFAFATVISALPFSTSEDITGATLEPGELNFCGSTPQTQSVWYSFTPSANLAVSADMAGSSFSDTGLTVYTAVGPGLGGLSLLSLACFGGVMTFSAHAGTTYYIQAESVFGNGGNLHLNLQQIPPPANDNFANATVVPSPLPFDNTEDITGATTEPGEPSASCFSFGPINTVWYAFTPTFTGSVTASFPSFFITPVAAVYTGSSLANLTELGCQTFGIALTFHAVAGTTYYFQVGFFSPGQMGGLLQFHLDVTPPPVASFYINPNDPSIFDTVQFCDSSFDPGSVGFQSFTWDFGDGATSTANCALHQYTRDGGYTVQHSVTTLDGRSASISQNISVGTHDVAITKINAPQSANAGQTRSILVNVNNKRYPEYVAVTLYKSVPNGYQFFVGSHVQPVPVSTGNRTTAFIFSYTFTNDDVSLGKVSFEAVAIILSARDALPADNEAISTPPTKVPR